MIWTNSKQAKDHYSSYGFDIRLVCVWFLWFTFTHSNDKMLLYCRFVGILACADASILLDRCMGSNYSKKKKNSRKNEKFLCSRSHILGCSVYCEFVCVCVSYNQYLMLNMLVHVTFSRKQTSRIGAILDSFFLPLFVSIRHFVLSDITFFSFWYTITRRLSHHSTSLSTAMIATLIYYTLTL